jgi:hypothetical protein
MNTMYPPVINPVTSPASGFWQVVTGTKSADAYIFCRNNNGEWSEAQYPDGVGGLLWSMNFALVSGTNIIEAVARVSPISDQYDSLVVNSTIHLISIIPEAYNVWNSFDEFGLLVSLPRNPEEKNSDYKNRIIDSNENPSNSTEEGLINGIAREIGVSNSDVEISRLSELMDETSERSLLNDDGNAIGTKLIGYAKDTYDHNPVFWGNIIADEGYWDGVDEESGGYTFLPHIWDPVASGVYEKWQMSGIGDHDDLWVDGPVEVWNQSISAYSWYMKIHTGYFYSAYASGNLSQ